jgi:hypothetical protein
VNGTKTLTKAIGGYETLTVVKMAVDNAAGTST